MIHLALPRAAAALAVALAAIPLAPLPALGAPPAAQAAPADQAAALHGSWAGWLYLDDGDVPLRVDLGPGGEGGAADALRAVLHLPAAGQFDITLGSARVEGDALVLAHPAAADPSIELRLPLHDPAERRSADSDRAAPAHLRGTVDWQGVDGVVELHAADRALGLQADAPAERACGTWGAPGEPALLVRREHWGDLVLARPADGAERTLFVDGEGWIVGPAYYVPAPVEQELRLERGASPADDALVVVDASGTRRLPRRASTAHELRVRRAGAELVGTLHLVAEPSAPCVVIAGGGNWGTRAEHDDVVTLLVAQGVSCLIYDKRGWGASEGERTVAFSETAADLRAFADALRERPDVDAARVGYVGLSRGGWYGALAAADDPRCAFFVSIVGPAVSVAVQETTARLAALQDTGASAAETARAEEFLRALWQYGRTGAPADRERYTALLHELAPTGMLDVLGGPDPDDAEEWRWSRLNADVDPLPALRRLRGPALALYGAADPHVSAAVSAPLMRDALWLADVRPAEVHVLSGADHGLRLVELPGEAEPRPFHRVPGRHPDAWSRVARFLHALPR